LIKIKTTIKLNSYDGAHDVSIHVSYFANNQRIAPLVMLDDGECYCKLAINVDVPLQVNEFVMHHDLLRLGHTEFVCVDPVVLKLLGRRFIEHTGRTVDYGYVKDQPAYRINPDRLAEARKASEPGNVDVLDD
jgi:hypothetical protein